MYYQVLNSTVGSVGTAPVRTVGPLEVQRLRALNTELPFIQRFLKMTDDEVTTHLATLLPDLATVNDVPLVNLLEGFRVANEWDITDRLMISSVCEPSEPMHIYERGVLAINLASQGPAYRGQWSVSKICSTKDLSATLVALGMTDDEETLARRLMAPKVVKATKIPGPRGSTLRANKARSKTGSPIGVVTAAARDAWVVENARRKPRKPVAKSKTDGVQEYGPATGTPTPKTPKNQLTAGQEVERAIKPVTQDSWFPPEVKANRVVKPKAESTLTSASRVETWVSTTRVSAAKPLFSVQGKVGSLRSPTTIESPRPSLPALPGSVKNPSSSTEGPDSE